MKAVIRLLGFFAFLTLASPVTALEWYQAYIKGEEAVNKGNCAEGKKLIDEALRKNPKSDLKSRPYGTFRMEYIPYFYLAKCAVSEQDTENARKYIKQAEQTSVYSSSKSSEFTQIKASFDKKFGSPTTTEKPPVTTTPAPTIEKPPPIKPTPPPVTTTPPATNQRNLFAEYSREANDALRRGDYSRARELANLMDQLQRNNVETRRILTEVERREQRQVEDSSKQQDIQKAQAAFKNGNPSAENMIFDLKLRYPSDPQVIALVRELEKRKESELKNLGDAQLTKALEKQVVVSFYRGHYESVIQLSEQSLQKNPNNWKVNFFVGCSYAALSILEAADRENRLNLAKQAFRKARVAPDQKISALPYISPKILDIYNKS